MRHGNHLCIPFFALLALPILILAPSLPPLQAQRPPASQGPVIIQNANDVIKHWSKDQHLYIKGDVGISSQQARKLEQWLDENGPHWTIVLMQNAQGETYRSLDNRRFYGMDAVEYALGYGLANRTDFGRLQHPNGQTDGAVFVLFLTEHKFSYYGSDIHDQRHLGEAQWIGDLDSEAIRAMRNGGRIVDAVRNTVSLINGRLEKKLAAEAAARKEAQATIERAKLERRRNLDHLRLRIDEARTDLLKRIETSARKLRNAFPQAAASKLAHPPLDNWKARLDDLKQDAQHIKIDDQNAYQRSIPFRKLTKDTNIILGEINAWLDQYAAHQQFGQMSASIENRLDTIADHPSGIATEVSQKAYDLLDQAQVEHDQGNPDFMEHLQEAEQRIEEGEKLIKQAEEEIKQKKERTRQIRKIFLIAGSILTLGFLGLLWLLNWRRRPALGRAFTLFEKRKKSVEVEQATMQNFIAQTEQVLGTRKQFDQRHFDGKTLALGNQVFDQIDQMQLILDQATERIHSADQLIHPTSPIAQAANLISGARYEHCVSMLTGETIRVTDPVSLPIRFTDQMDEPVWMTFEQAFAELRHRQSQTGDQVKQIDQSLKNIDPQIKTLQQRLAEATELEQSISRDAKLDRYFAVPAFFEKLLPAVQQDVHHASKLATTDPVQAMDQSVPDGLRKINQGLAIIHTIQTARTKLFPQLETAAKELEKRGFDTRWMDHQVQQLSERANTLIETASETDISEEARSFEASVQRLGLRAKRCVELAHDITEKVEPDLEKLEKEIEETRTRIARHLKLSENQVLHESGYDPDVELAKARSQLQSARASLDYGGVESAMESLEILDSNTATARKWLAISRDALERFPQVCQAHRKRSQAIARLFPRLHQLVEEATRKYHASAWIIQTDDPIESEAPASDTSPDTSPTPTQEAPETIATLTTRAEQLVQSSAKGIDQAEQLYHAGKILEAANRLDRIQHDLHIARELQKIIAHHCQSLDNQVIENRNQLAQQIQSLETLELRVNDFRTQSPTRQFYEAIVTDSHALYRELDAPSKKRNPFEDQKNIHKLARRMEELEAMIQSDWSSHAELERSLAGAEAELETVKQSVYRSLNDRIPDSTTIKQCQTEAERLEEELDELKEQTRHPHGNWRSLSLDADRITGDLGIVDGTLQRELDLAQQAVRELRQASAEVFDTASWRGDYGIQIISEPGSFELDQARIRLSEGEYQAVIDYSRSAVYEARRALAEAERLVAEEHQRRIAAAAAARRRSQSSIFSGGSSSSFPSWSSDSSWSSGSWGGGSWGGGSWGGGSSSSSSWGGSSSSSSSWGGSSSGSGFSRSGW